MAKYESTVGSYSTLPAESRQFTNWLHRNVSRRLSGMVIVQNDRPPSERYFHSIDFDGYGVHRDFDDWSSGLTGPDVWKQKRAELRRLVKEYEPGGRYFVEGP